MNTLLLNEIIACLPKGKTHYRYFKGAYASRLLSILLPEQASVSILKQTRFKKLLDHPTIKPVVANCGNGVLERKQLTNIWQEPSQPFLLAVSRWGGKQDRSWYQTSRFGENLVLQLNLPVEHDRRYKAYNTSEYASTANGRYSDHPVQLPQDNPNFRETLAWSRLDIDFDTGEALIEEVQTDIARTKEKLPNRYSRRNTRYWEMRCRYYEWLQPYQQIWSEALLCATIEFIQNHLGLERIFLHTARSGWQVKNMDKDWHAPRSLYSDLPRKFAFKQTWAAPEFLLATRCYQRLIRKQPDIDFYQLSLNELREHLSHPESTQCHPEEQSDEGSNATSHNSERPTGPIERVRRPTELLPRATERPPHHSERSEESNQQNQGATPCHAE